MPAERGRRPTASRGDERPSGWHAGFAETSEDRRALLILASLRTMTPAKLLAHADRLGSAAACLAALRSGRIGTDADRGIARRLRSEDLDRALRACGARLVAVGDPDYPPGLGELADPPAAVFVRGRPPAERPRRVAVVGARSCTALGHDVAEALGHGLAVAGAGVISGAARGIDAAAHEGALRAEGATVAVLGCGIDAPLGSAPRRLLDRILATGSVVSEYAPGVPAEPRNFPSRNRIIAALSEAVVVVEGTERSGSLITTDHALDLGRTVFAVPGAVTESKARAPLSLLREGATPIRGVADLLDDLGLDAHSEDPPSPPEGLSEPELAVWRAVGHAVLAESVAQRTGLTVPAAVAVLMELELRGLVRSVGGRYQRRVAADDVA